MKDFEKLDSSFSNLFLQGREAFFFFLDFKISALLEMSLFLLCVFMDLVLYKERRVSEN